MSARLFYLHLAMAHRKLKNYVRTYRKRMNLSQDEVAYLLAAHSGAKVSRYERFRREPSLRTALAYSVIFQAPLEEIFAGLYSEIERNTTERMRLLAGKLDRSDSRHASETRRKALVIALLESHPAHTHK
jgi:transcriptional regulator with XRE-family HTH domain